MLTTGTDEMREEHPERDSPFYSLLRDNPNFPRTPLRPRCARVLFDSYGDSTKRIHVTESGRDLRGILSEYQPFMGIIWIQEIDEDLVYLLCEVFPADNLLKFLHQHATRWEGHGEEEFDSPELPAHPVSYRKELSWQVQNPNETDGLHFDGFCVAISTHHQSTSSEPTRSSPQAEVGASFRTRELTRSCPDRPYRLEILTHNGHTIQKVTTRISCCMLRPKLRTLSVET